MCKSNAHDPSNGKTPWYLVSMRPQGRHSGLGHAVAKVGGRLIAASPWRIVYRSDPATRRALQDALNAPTLVFTSPEAVNAAHNIIPLSDTRSLEQKWIGIGTSTARTIQTKGIRQVCFPSQMHSEALIALAEYQDAQCLGLITADGGRDLIAKHAIKNGKIVYRADVYERKPIPITAETWRSLTDHWEHLCLAISSHQACSMFLDQMPGSLSALLGNCPVVVTSDRLVEWLQTCGFNNIHIAQSPEPECIARAAAHVMTQKQF